MRALLAASVGSLCTAALMVPLAQPAAAQFPTATDNTRNQSPSSPDERAPRTSLASADSDRPARTVTVPLSSLQAEERVPGDNSTTGATRLGEREVAPFSMLGVVWDDADLELPTRIEVRTRASDSGDWTKWKKLENHSTDAPDPHSAERAAGTVRGTAPLWVGDSDAVDVRLVPEPGQEAEAPPEGLRLSLIDPGGGQQAAGAAKARAERPDGTPYPAAHEDEAADHSVAADAKPAGPAFGPAAVAAAAVDTQLAAMNTGQTASRAQEQATAELLASQDGRGNAGRIAAPIGPRPGIVTRAGWGANESWREPGFSYTTTVKSAFVHHTAESNNYTCAQAPSIIRGIYQYHVRSLGWRDIGYNFLVDKCGKIYEGRAGGVAKAVMGAHTYGFNSNTTGIAVLGSYGSTAPPKAAVEGVAKLIAWKLGLHGLNPVGSVTLTSGGGKWPAGTKVKMRAVAGHRDGFSTECPGAQLYSKLGSIRELAARLQGR